MEYLWTIPVVLILGVLIVGVNSNGHINIFRILSDLFDTVIDSLHDSIFKNNKNTNAESELLPEQRDKIWKSFIVARSLYREAKETHKDNLKYIARFEQNLIYTERALQDPKRGFYMGASKDLMNLRLGEFPLYLKYVS